MKKAALRVSQPGNCCRSNGTAAAQATTHYTLYTGGGGAIVGSTWFTDEEAKCAVSGHSLWQLRQLRQLGLPALLVGSDDSRQEQSWRNENGLVELVFPPALVSIIFLHLITTFWTCCLFTAAFIRLLLSSALYTTTDALMDPTVTKPREIPLWLHD